MKKRYFLTGATGVIGSALIPLLLEDDEIEIWALMRGDSQNRLTERLENLIRFWKLNAEQVKEVRHRIMPVRGDMSEPRFGISRHEYADIVANSTHIIHCAGVVRMNLPLEEAQRQAVGSTRNIVELAQACQATGNLRKIEYVSTVGIAGRKAGELQETWVTEPRKFHNTYEASKAEAEDYLRDQIDLHDLPVTVHRPSMVVGDSKTGRIVHFQVFYHLCEFLSGRRTAGLFPFLKNACLDTIPMDYVARAIKWSADNTVASGRIFHHCTGPLDSIEISALRKLVRSRFLHAGVNLPPVIPLPFVCFSTLIKLARPLLNEKSKRAVSTLPIFLDYLSERQLFANHETLLFFERHHGPALPAVKEYLETIIDYYIQKEFLT